MKKEETNESGKNAEVFNAEKIVNENTAEAVKAVLEAMNAEIERLKKDNATLKDWKNYEMEARLKTEKKIQAMRALLETF